jgi:hypothetical protein
MKIRHWVPSLLISQEQLQKILLQLPPDFKRRFSGVLETRPLAANIRTSVNPILYFFFASPSLFIFSIDNSIALRTTH